MQINKETKLSLYDKIILLSIYSTGLKSSSTIENISINEFLNTKSSQTSLENLYNLGLLDSSYNLLDAGYALVKKIKSSYVNYEQKANVEDVSSSMAMLSAATNALYNKATTGKSPIQIYEGRNLHKLLQETVATLQLLINMSVSVQMTEKEINLDELM